VRGDNAASIEPIVVLTNEELNALTKQRFGNMHQRYAEGFRRLMCDAIEANAVKSRVASAVLATAKDGEDCINCGTRVDPRCGCERGRKLAAYYRTPENAVPPSSTAATSSTDRCYAPACGKWDGNDSCTCQRVTATEAQLENLDVAVHKLATTHALDRTGSGGWIFENHKLFLFAHELGPKYPAATKAVSLTDDARECLMDVVTHHHDFRTACIEVKASNETTRSDESYWQKQIDVLDRMRAQAERALAARGQVTTKRDEPRLDKPAQVGGTRFHAGVKWSTVIAATQRHFEYMQTPEKEAERIEKGKALVEYLLSGQAASPEAAENEALLKALAECREAFPVPEEGSTLDGYWVSAVGDPFEVPAYIRAALAAQKVAENTQKPNVKG
jgi:hypothetical protein